MAGSVKTHKRSLPRHKSPFLSGVRGKPQSFDEARDAEMCQQEQKERKLSPPLPEYPSVFLYPLKPMPWE